MFTGFPVPPGAGGGIYQEDRMLETNAMLSSGCLSCSIISFRNVLTDSGKLRIRVKIVSYI